MLNKKDLATGLGFSLGLGFVAGLEFTSGLAKPGTPASIKYKNDNAHYWVY